MGSGVLSFVLQECNTEDSDDLERQSAHAQRYPAHTHMGIPESKQAALGRIELLRCIGYRPAEGLLHRIGGVDNGDSQPSV
mgnify:CR=1 FL=1